ncbi:TniQ family protein [Streptomyces sp. NPDC007251]|uniref:TniQ family protein n=1 Tax=Streptomyces sp. NPDC007251 TaxID=3154483 RepID=UPI0033BFCF12
MPSAPPRPSIRRVAPLQWETTASYIQRLARRHHLTTAELLNGLGIPRPRLKKELTQPHAPHTGIELYLNAPSRRLIASFTGVPEEHLSYALPQWDQYRDKPNPASARARLQPAPINAVTGCPGCTLARTGHRHPVRQYLPDSRLICRRHHTWMLGRHTFAGTQLPIEHADLGHTPEILAAHRTHIRFLRRWGAAADHALAQATSLTEAWRAHSTRARTHLARTRPPHRQQQAHPPVVRPRPSGHHLPRNHHPRPIHRPPPPNASGPRTTPERATRPHRHRRPPGPALASRPGLLPRPAHQPDQLRPQPPPRCTPAVDVPPARPHRTHRTRLPPTENGPGRRYQPRHTTMTSKPEHIGPPRPTLLPTTLME